jgi:hypothetical protein
MHPLSLMACGRIVGAAALIMLTIPACLTVRQGERIQADLDGVRARLDDIDRWDREHRRQVAELRSVLDQASALLTANDEVPEAMWQLSMAFVELGFCTDARSLLGDLVKRYPKSSSATQAQKEMRTIRSLPKRSCTS